MLAMAANNQAARTAVLGGLEQERWAHNLRIRSESRF